MQTAVEGSWLDWKSWHGLTIVHVFLSHGEAAADRVVSIDFVVVFVASWRFQYTQRIPLQLHFYTILQNLIFAIICQELEQATVMSIYVQILW